MDAFPPNFTLANLERMVANDPVFLALQSTILAKAREDIVKIGLEAKRTGAKSFTYVVTRTMADATRIELAEELMDRFPERVERFLLTETLSEFTCMTVEARPSTQYRVRI